MKRNFSIVTKGWIGVLILIIWIFSLMFNLIAPISSIIISHEILLNFKDYKKDFLKVDTIYSTGSSEDGSYSFLHGRTNNKIISKLGSGRYYFEDKNEIINKYSKNGKYLDIWVSPKTKYAYFDTPDLNNTTQMQLLYRPLTEICLFVLMTFIIYQWSKYFKKELLKYGLTTKEFHKLRKENKLDEYLKNYERQN